MSFFYFLGKIKFYKHLLLIIAISVLIFFGVIKGLDFYTRHGKVFIIPDFYGKTVDELKQNHYEEYFELQIIDSVYDRNNPPGAILMQNPVAGSKVKQGRNVYLTVVAQMPEKTIMPNLKNLSLRQALVSLEMSKLKAGNLIYVDYFARNAVIDQTINDEIVEEGTELNTGSTIDLTVGKGRLDVKVNMPLIIGKKHAQVVKALHYASLNIGNEYFMDSDDTTHARVFRTEPDIKTSSLVDLGKQINVWYRSDLEFDFDEYLLQFTNDTINVDSLENQIKYNNADEF